MTAHSCLRLPVRYRKVPARRANPFHWALLEALRVFPSSARPTLDELALRLCLDDKAFLEKAWSELKDFQAVNAGDFGQAELSAEGTETLASGYFHLGPVVEKTVALLLNPQDGSSAYAALPKNPQATALPLPPVWAATLDQGQLADTLRRQENLRRDERLLSLRCFWDKAELVSV